MKTVRQFVNRQSARFAVETGMPRLFFVFWLALLPLAAAAAEPSLTIYHQNFAVVRGSVALELKAGVTEIHFADLTAQVEPSSVVLRDPAGQHDFQVLEQGYRGDPVSQAFLLAQFEAQTIDFLVHQPQKPDAVVPGRIVRSGYQTNGEPMIEVNGKLRFDLPGTPLFPKLADDNILQPELIWKISSAAPAKSEAEIDYLTGGMSWSADYNITIPESGDDLQLTGWVTIDNQSGKRFENARTKLISGEVNKVAPTTPAPRAKADTVERVVVTGSYIPVPEKAFDEFHLYTLPRPVTLRDRESKQIEFIRAAGIHSQRLYVFDATGYESPATSPKAHC